jgi:hypothetical protein
LCFGTGVAVAVLFAFAVELVVALTVAFTVAFTAAFTVVGATVGCGESKFKFSPNGRNIRYSITIPITPARAYL